MDNGRMLGAVLHGEKDVRMEYVGVPEPKDGEVIVKIVSALTCGTDLKVYKRGGHPRMLKPPTLFGHEFSGVVEAVGPGTNGLMPGQAVACHNSAPCNTCFYCRQGKPTLCENLLFINGAFAEYIRVPAQIVAQNLHPLRDSLPFDEACLMEPLSCVMHGIGRMNIREGSSIAVIGDGAIGLMFVAVLAERGYDVILSGGNPRRLAIGEAFGAAQIVNYKDTSDEVAAVRKLANHGHGPDYVIECTGKREVWEQSVEMACKGGLVNLFGGCPGEKFALNTETVHYNEVQVMGVFHSTPAHVKEALDWLVARRGKLRPLISTQLPLGRLQEAFPLMEQREAFKVAIDPMERAH